MSDYHPNNLSQKWGKDVRPLFEGIQSNWENRKKPLRSTLKEVIGKEDWLMFPHDKFLLHQFGYVVPAHFARAFLGAYVPGRDTFFGSVVYSVDSGNHVDVFDAVYKVNQLREDDSRPPVGTESIANAMRNDKSQFSRLPLPECFDFEVSTYLANICIVRKRLPLGYIHDRLVPVLIAPGISRRCTLLPLQYWTEEFKELWSSGMPAYDREPFYAALKNMGVEP